MRSFVFNIVSLYCRLLRAHRCGTSLSDTCALKTLQFHVLAYRFCFKLYAVQCQPDVLYL